jgi:purine-cytosine permease-like protein
MIDAVVAGQILSAVSPNGSLTVIAGIIIVAVITFVVTTFGIKVFHYYERYAWVSQWAVLMILAGTAGGRFDVTTQSVGDATTIIGNRISFLSVCLSAAITYSPGAADFLVYCDPKLISRAKVFWSVLFGLSISFSLCFMLGVGLASGIGNDPEWEEAGAGSGALIVAGYNQLGGFGKFCSVIVALGLIANMVPPTYSAGIDFQILGRYPAMVPRFLWNAFGVIIFAVCALAGRDNLAVIFTNFLALMGYWVVMWIAITLEEQFIFRRRMDPTFIWDDWNKPQKLPIGIAAIIAFLIGWVGSILCMAQHYYIGPIAILVGEYGADLGNFVGFMWAALVYPPLRYLELKKFGR